MKFTSWNVNGLRACANKGFFDFFNTDMPDIMAIQETKMQRSQLEFDFPGYHLYMNDAEKKGYSGTLVLSKIEPLNVIYDIEDEGINEGRVITLEFEDYYFVCAYVPNSKDGLLRIDFRQIWEDRLRAHLKKLDEKKPVIYTGDLNVAHEEIDLKNPSTNHFSAGFSDQERNKMTELLSAGFKDTFRELYPEKVQYSWWSYRQAARERNVGWRIDYFIVSDRIMERVKDSIIRDDIFGSDHCPVTLEIDI